MPAENADTATAGVIAVGALGFAPVADDGGGVKAADVRVTPSTVPTTAPSANPTVTTVVGRPPATTAPAPPATTKPAPPERLSAESRLRLDGVGPVDVGMTLQEASTAAGMPIRTNPGDHDGPESEYAYAAQGLDDLALCSTDGSPESTSVTSAQRG